MTGAYGIPDHVGDDGKDDMEIVTSLRSSQ